ncbi:lon protease [Naegleria gruberi]|uniref:Lon protease homolog n=1 Tax=Naegleria gruberi TaxID=5762 RepID=D2VDX6_NAEGR|nr:lon protease [Naegleria gruberi]EFC44978.1 lon protease [Naegleria gruberi]|eukprot:XP_002677722.1 lon protease [Naegleria gruberi]
MKQLSTPASKAFRSLLATSRTSSSGLFRKTDVVFGKGANSYQQEQLNSSRMIIGSLQGDLKSRFFSTSTIHRNEKKDDEDNNDNDEKKKKEEEEEQKDVSEKDKTQEINKMFDDFESSRKSDEINDIVEDSAERIEELLSDKVNAEDVSDKASKLLSPVKQTEQSITSFFATPTPPFVEIVPLYKKPAFPGTIVPIFITDTKFIQSMLESGYHDKLVGLFLVKDLEKRDQMKNVASLNEIETVGTLAKVTRVVPSKGGASVVFAAIRRIKVTGTVNNSKRLTANIEEVTANKVDKNDLSIKAHVMEIFQQIKEFLSHIDPVQREQLNMVLEQLDHTDPAELSDIAAILCSHDPETLQEILQTTDIRLRLVKSLELLKSEVETKKIQEKIQRNLEEKLNNQQRKMYLTEQLKIIKKELGLEKDAKEELMKKFSGAAEQIKSRDNVPELVKTTLQDELNKFSTLDPHSSEYTNVRNYLDWMTSLPWGLRGIENFDLIKASNILDHDHYGLKKVKERILEFIAVGKLKNTTKGKIILLMGPPGVGKTSIGKSIASSLGREFHRFSVGGLTDVSEIKGHRRTYIGSIPGKLINIMKHCKTNNPVIMIDEIDKLGRSHQGDPASALLEVLDPEQNNAFVDHYLDVPYDLSDVLFVCTANVLDSIPGPLLDRMEVLRLSGYILEEKVHITRNYLLPKKIEETGLYVQKAKEKKPLLTVTNGLIEKLIREHCREAGVRNLEKHIELICRKVAYKIAKSNKKPAPIHLTENDLEELVGKPVFTSDRYYLTTPVGVTMGLAWTSMGGSTLYIETISEKLGQADIPVATTDNATTTASVPMNGSLKCTGSMGDVMKESSSIAYSYAKNHLFNVDPKNDFFRKTNIHMHIPEGGVNKDGPSAGVTMVTSLLSLALNKPVRHNLAMTGELTITGKVLAIGGVKEKVIAARRSGITTVILPAGNRRDWDELDENIKKGLEVHFADYYSDVFRISFGYDEAENLEAIEKDRQSPNLMDLSS